MQMDERRELIRPTEWDVDAPGSLGAHNEIRQRIGSYRLPDLDNGGGTGATFTATAVD